MVIDGKTKIIKSTFEFNLSVQGDYKNIPVLLLSSSSVVVVWQN